MMLSTTFVIISFSMITAMKAMNYTVTKIVDETVTVYENSLFDLETIGFNNDSKVYMIINQPITDKDDLLINFVAERFDGVKFPLPDNPMKLCKFLFEERSSKLESYIQQFHISRAFNLEDQICPILPGKRKLLPYMFPKNVTLLHDIGCGDFVYTVEIFTNDTNNFNEDIASEMTQEFWIKVMLSRLEAYEDRIMHTVKSIEIFLHKSIEILHNKFIRTIFYHL